MQYRGLTLDTFQSQSIQSLQDGHSVLVCAPTGTGKTLIADWIVDQALADGQRVIYTAPIKALSNQKFRDYGRLHGFDRVGLVTGDLVINRDAPCLVMTTEILRNILLSDESVDDLRAVVVDEIHFLDDRERGTTWEELLIYLPEHVQVVGLSATLSNQSQFQSWLEHVRGRPVDVVTETRRAVPLHIRYMATETGLVTPEDYTKVWKRKGRNTRPQERHRGRYGRNQRGRGRGGNDRGKGRPRRSTTHLHIFDELMEHGLLPTLYFVFSRRDTEMLARALGRHVEGSLLTDPEDQARLDEALLNAAKELGPALDPEIRALYAKGIAFHHAGLHVQLKALVESLYEEKLIRMLYCTSTFALGINMPARAACFDGLRMYDGRGFNPLATRQFMQMAGRAGRRGLDEVGHVVVRMDLDDYGEFQPILKRYASGTPEPVRSSFSLSWNSICNLLDSHGIERVRQIVAKSFLNWHLSSQAQYHEARAEELLSGNTTRGERKEASRLKKRAKRATTRCWDEFQAKLGFLVDVGYLEADLSFNAGARILRHLQISEILMTELILNGELDHLEAPDLFGVLCAVTNELPRRVRRNTRVTGYDRRLGRMLKDVRHSDRVVDAEEMSGIQQPLDVDLIALGRAWAQGKDLQEVLLMVFSETDISGDLINGFRRAKDLAGQLRDVYRDIPDMNEMLAQLIRDVKRDEVEVVD